MSVVIWIGSSAARRLSAPLGLGLDNIKVQNEWCRKQVRCQQRAHWSARGSNGLAGESCRGNQRGAPHGCRGRAPGERGFLSRRLIMNYFKHTLNK